MKLPKGGDFITIQGYKYDGSLHRTRRDTIVPKITDNAVIGVNDHTLVTEGDERRWVTREPTILYFHKKYWSNIIVMIRDNGVSYYHSLASSYVMDEEAPKHIDYDLDVKVFVDGEKRLLDVDEYELHKQEMGYSPDIDFILKENVKILVDWINNGKGPFLQAYINIWCKRYLELKNRQRLQALLFGVLLHYLKGVTHNGIRKSQRTLRKLWCRY